MDNNVQAQLLADPITRQEMLRAALAAAKAIKGLPESENTPSPGLRRPRKSGE